MFNCDMVLYYLRNYMDLGKSPKEMIDPNTRTDYNKMKKLIRLDKLDGNRKGVLRKITEEGQIITTLTTTFPAIDITKPEIFPSLLFYYGMLTITATRGNYLVLSIPNNNVRKQYYEFLLEEYQDCSCLQGKLFRAKLHRRRAQLARLLYCLPEYKCLLPDSSGTRIESRLL